MGATVLAVTEVRTSVFVFLFLLYLITYLQGFYILLQIQNLIVLWLTNTPLFPYITFLYQFTLIHFYQNSWLDGICLYQIYKNILIIIIINIFKKKILLDFSIKLYLRKIKKCHHSFSKCKRWEYC